MSYPIHDRRTTRRRKARRRAPAPGQLAVQRMMEADDAEQLPAEPEPHEPIFRLPPRRPELPSMTKRELMAELDEHGIDYDLRAKKSELRKQLKRIRKHGNGG